MPICLEEVADPAPSAEDDDAGQKKGKRKKEKPKKRKRYRRPTDAHPNIPRAGFRITEWCARYNFGRTHFYELKKKHKGPKVTDVDGVQIITIEDDNAWRKERARDAA